MSKGIDFWSAADLKETRIVQRINLHLIDLMVMRSCEIPSSILHRWQGTVTLCCSRNVTGDAAKQSRIV